MSGKLLTLVIVFQDNRVLLGMKKRGFGAGWWNGFGGKVAAGESIEDAARRELQEEAGIAANNLEKMGVLDFEFQGNSQMLQVHIFRSADFSGDPVETEEMKPQWFGIDHMPLDQMWPDDRYWLPLFLAGKKLKGKFVFGESNTIIEQELTEVITLNHEMGG